MTSDHLAKEADRLQSDPIFGKAMDDIRADALDALAHADADDKTLILRLQQRVSVVEEIRATLGRYIVAADQSAQEDASPYA